MRNPPVVAIVIAVSLLVEASPGSAFFPSVPDFPFTERTAAVRECISKLDVSESLGQCSAVIERHLLSKDADVRLETSGFLFSIASNRNILEVEELFQERHNRHGESVGPLLDGVSLAWMPRTELIDLYESAIKHGKIRMSRGKDLYRIDAMSFSAFCGFHELQGLIREFHKELDPIYQSRKPLGYFEAVLEITMNDEQSARTGLSSAVSWLEKQDPAALLKRSIADSNFQMALAHVLIRLRDSTERYQEQVAAKIAKEIVEVMQDDESVVKRREQEDQRFEDFTFLLGNLASRPATFMLPEPATGTTRKGARHSDLVL